MVNFERCTNGLYMAIDAILGTAPKFQLSLGLGQIWPVGIPIRVKGDVLSLMRLT